MTIDHAVKEADKLKPNQYEYDQKVRWLRRLDNQIHREVIATHEGGFPFREKDYENPNHVLLVPEPDCADVYLNFLQAMMAKEDGEISKYNQFISAYNAAFSNFCAWYNKYHSPLCFNGGRFLL